jgi:hypothetical protein
MTPGIRDACRGAELLASAISDDFPRDNFYWILLRVTKSRAMHQLSSFIARTGSWGSYFEDIYSQQDLQQRDAFDGGKLAG